MSAKKLLIVAHTPSQNTAAMLDAVVSGARSPGIENVEVEALGPFDTQPAHVLAANAIVLGTTENLGYMSGALKDFFDRCYYPCLDDTQGLAFAFYIRAGHDGTGTRIAIEKITTGLKWRQVYEPLICKGTWTNEFLPPCEELGATVAAGLDAGIF